LRVSIPLLISAQTLMIGVGCASIPSTDVLASVKVASEESFDESKYDYLGIVEGHSFMMGIASQAGEGNAIATCKGEAFKLGATHIVIISKGGVATTNVVAKAYRRKQI